MTPRYGRVGERYRLFFRVRRFGFMRPVNWDAVYSRTVERIGRAPKVKLISMSPVEDAKASNTFFADVEVVKNPVPLMLVGKLVIAGVGLLGVLLVLERVERIVAAPAGMVLVGVLGLMALSWLIVVIKKKGIF